MYLWAVNRFNSQPAGERGALMIIGGGSRPDVIIERILEESDLSDPEAFGLVLTMSSFNPDTSGFYGEKTFPGQMDSKICTHSIWEEGIA
ncbi:MAG: hypothetical protein U5K71_04230 [Gracilimonas sp.]|nr:hypothetical protein [Gracilimonas sp.]